MLEFPLISLKSCVNQGKLDSSLGSAHATDPSVDSFKGGFKQQKKKCCFLSELLGCQNGDGLNLGFFYI